MTWKSISLAVLFFYLFALLQSSFFAHFQLFGLVPNLVFIFFFLLVFFSAGTSKIIPLAVSGILLDILSHTYLGPTMIIFIIIGLVLKFVQSSMIYGEDKRPFSYFMLLFVAGFIMLEILEMVYLRFFDLSHTAMNFDLELLAGLVYNFAFACLGFWIYKKYEGKI